MPSDTRTPSVKAKRGLWHEAHATVPLAERRVSKKSNLPNSIFLDKSLPSTGETGGLHGSLVSAQVRLDSTPKSCDVNVIVTSSGKQVVKVRRSMILNKRNPGATL